MTRTTSKSEAHLRQALHGYATDLAATHTAPPASLVWLRARHQAQRNARNAALARATLPLRIMQAVGLFSAIFTCGWFLRQSHAAESAAFNTTLLHWAAPAVLIVIAGCWTLLHTSRQPLIPNP